MTSSISPERNKTAGTFFEARDMDTTDSREAKHGWDGCTDFPVFNFPNYLCNSLGCQPPPDLRRSVCESVARSVSGAQYSQQPRVPSRGL